VVPVESGWRLMKVDRRYNDETFMVFKPFSIASGEQWKKFRNCRNLRMYIVGSTTRNVFGKNFTLRVVEPAMCFENVFFLW